MMNKILVTLRVDGISNICWKGQLSKLDFLKKTFYLNLLEGEFSRLYKQK